MVTYFQRCSRNVQGERERGGRGRERERERERETEKWRKREKILGSGINQE